MEGIENNQACVPRLTDFAQGQWVPGKDYRNRIGHHSGTTIASQHRIPWVGM